MPRLAASAANAADHCGLSSHKQLTGVFASSSSDFTSAEGHRAGTQSGYMAISSAAASMKEAYNLNV
jgi:hypothetical protein